MSQPSKGSPLWRPTADWSRLRLRARILRQIRGFFEARGVLEVETPLLAGATVTDPHLASLETRLGGPGGRRLFLQTSPEFAMKRLLAAGSGSIFQICKAFRNGEVGRFHNPEFTMLEWYRPGFELEQLMEEVDDLLQLVLGGPAARRRTLAQVAEEYGGFDPHGASAQCLRQRAVDLELSGLPDLPEDDRAGWRDLLVSHVVEPRLGQGSPDLIFDYPVDQAALAEVSSDSGAPVARRFEAYVDGVELANGYQELRDAAELRRRFESDLAERQERGLPSVPVDENLLAAMESGLPFCSGVSIGIDRLVLLAAGAEALEDVIAIPVDRV
ncbi:MAG: EF-P lysine aminoacylase GenX [Deltaproteobacteria bacterium]|nr:EF-P lysine aminoacylase GenX [Deltaproteobacteria bacterium]